MKVARVTAARAVPYALALPRPLVTSAGRFAAREGWWVRLEDSEGRVGFGDVAPWPGFGVGPANAAGEVEQAVAAVLGRRVDTVAQAVAPSVRHGLALALDDLQAQAAEQPLARWLAPDALDRVQSHVLVDDAAAARATRAPALKVKVGAGPLAEDLARLSAIRDARPDAELRLDANGAWAPVEADAALRALAAFEPAWVEQPLSRFAPPEAFRRLRRWCRVAADESVTGSEALQTLLDAQAVDAVILKPMFVGGPAAAVALGHAALARGVTVCVTHAFGSAVGRWAAVHVACALAAAGPVAAGLTGGPDTPGLPGPVADDHGWIHLPQAPGLGGQPTW
ncbi:MAG: hypothetical protein H6702_07650 [Myxococcales bacterium]|nr:hypothetical protein [Myxococcales bacterium]